MEDRRRWRWLAVAAVAGLVIIGGLGVRLAMSWNRRARLAEARVELAVGQPARAAGVLRELTAEVPGWDQAEFLLGECERGLGRREAAARAWSEVPAGSPLADRAVAGRAILLADAGRLADAEALLREALEDPRVDPAEPRQVLADLCAAEGRAEEAVAHLEAAWEALDRSAVGGVERAIALADRHRELAAGSSEADEGRRALLEGAARIAPDDDRAWLGRARLAIRQGRTGEADRLLDACLARRPDDPAVWGALLDAAIAEGREAGVRRALEHLPDGSIPPARSRRVAAWLAAREGDAGAELDALRALLALTPEDDEARERLVGLEEAAGHSERAEALRREGGELDQVSARLRSLRERGQPLRDAWEIARLATRLGRRFEARVFSDIAARVAFEVAGGPSG